ncbi:MAG: isoprenylcysteine carboxylmethyltransferase family protein [Methanolobus sp.]|nr:isoprenylcysteine carboxylmethyltransferase family protein [Methanolobus sp.]
MLSPTIVLIFCLLAFAVIHSILASLRFKRMISNALGSKIDSLYMPLYSIIAVITLAPLVYLLYMNPGEILYVMPSPWFWFMAGGQAIAALVAPRALLDAPHRFRLRSQLSVPQTPDAGKLDVRGIYRWVRDPFLLSGLVIIWLTPFMTVNLLVLYILATIYLVLGSLHWESRLVAQFGDEYREYQQKVHRIIPRLKGYDGK